ncbi:hypothetical protein WA026_001325 [Henosepilachna vigintioctopunctata]|uniref:Uncharacterized protein n=1 Tax=Henosepilachna vigintioctopunctata TaxID=420089 RepID=A0AAW1UQU6_9CUCU
MIYKNIITVFAVAHIFIEKCEAQYFDYINIHIEKDGKLYELLEQESILLEKNVTSVLIEDQKVPTLKRGSFENLTRLKKVSLNKNGIITLENGCFKNLPQLRVLKIHFNKIEELNGTIFHNLPITKLSLIGNGLKYIGENVLNTLTQLQELNLRGNSLSVLPKHLLQDTKYLERIDLSDNKISSIPDGFFYEAFIYRQFGQPTIINLSQNELTSFTDQIFDGVHYIQNLILSNNLIRDLSNNMFKKIRSIETIDLQRNLLTEISKELLDGFFQKPYKVLLSGNNFSLHFIKMMKRWTEADKTRKYVQLDWDANGKWE